MILGWGAAGLLSCGLSGREFDHYAIHSLPGTSLTAGWLLARLWPNRLNKSLHTLFRVSLVGACAAMALANCIRVYRQIDDTPNPETAILQAFAQRHSKSNARWFVWGYFPEIYGWVQRLPASRFVYVNFLTGMIPWTNQEPSADTSYAIAPDV
ncbi:MAG: hypothetical protein J6386_01955 [Candidatus Synoicihabitans palmerolidicus]|nr:hypothetical protein [Candidatus Synoicihabitans palmerolidicus]